MPDPRPRETRRIRVLHLIGCCQVGGLERVALSLVSRLRAEFDFRVVAFDDATGPLRESFESEGAPVTFLRRSPGVDLAYPFRLARYMRREGIDVVHCHNGTALFYGVMAAILAPGRRVVFTAHDRSVPQVRVRPIQKLLGRRTSWAVAVSDLGRRDLLSVDGFREERVVVVHNGASAGEAETPAGARAALGLPAGAEVVGTVARLQAEKNVPLLIRAFARVAARRPSAWLVIAGDGGDRARCEDAARESGCPERIRILGTRRDVARILSATDVFALSSDREGLPLAVLEAMGAERPIVSTDAGAIREVVSDGVNGRIVAPRDEAAFASALEELLSDPVRAREMGRKGRETYLRGFTLERMADRYGRVYREAMEGVL